MTAGFRIDADAGPPLAYLGRAIALMADPRPMLDEIGARLVTSTRHRFETERAPDGTPWVPSKASYRRGAPRGRNRDRGQTGTDTGRLRASIARIVRRAELLVGTNVDYAGYFHFGTPPHVIRPKTKKALWWPGAAHPVRHVDHPGQPARPFVGISAGDDAAIRRIVGRWLEAA